MSFFRTIADALRRASGRDTSGEVEWLNHGLMRANITFKVHVEPDEVDGGYVAACLNLPGCISQGESVEEALDNLGDAIAGVLSARMEREVQARRVEEHPSTAATDIAFPLFVEPADEHDHVPT